jgi:hypothetical protein
VSSLNVIDASIGNLNTTSTSVSTLNVRYANISSLNADSWISAGGINRLYFANSGKFIHLIN